ncbi:uncharacterized protein BX663DRAFT_430763 [Cokeromyces recurvatus]|uniref:uncharacterized protein n=1 Tax=Cokeromyces recurvatus TaxID=90255 RepID=UPI00221E5711|nr:uncharacterized protein BX663DRAFT_430763 [Cokeromyces recurvatus]KAI7905183.1 hypothetical protein BX663DRAFT_430763 [Cokeromyces recurvatus]
MNSLQQVDEIVKEYLLVDKIIDELLGAIANGDIHTLIDYFQYLDLRFFSRLDNRFQTLPYIRNPSNDPTFEIFFTKQWVDNYTISLHNFLATTFQNMPLPTLLTFNIDRIQRKTQQTEIEALKNTIENQKALLEARENDIAKLKHEVVETRKEMTDGISLMRNRKRTIQDNQKNPIVNNPKMISSPNNDAITSMEDEEPFLIISHEEFAEHASAITCAKFSTQGDLIASCDMDNIVRIWNYKDSSLNPLRIKNNSSNLLSLEWDAKSDRFYRINQLSSSPVEPIFICASSSNKMHSDKNNAKGALVVWSMKTSSACVMIEIKKKKKKKKLDTVNETD